MSEIVARSERMTRARIADFPDGDYHARDCLDGDGRSEAKAWVDVRIRIRGSDIVADLTGSSDQSSGGMNCSHSAAASAVQYAIKSITDPENPPNAGSYRPIAVRTRPGSLVDASKPGSMVGFGDVCYRVLDATMAAIAGAVRPARDSERIGVDRHGPSSPAAGSGKKARTTSPRVELSSGAYGACAARDGINAMRYGPGNAGHIPIEAGRDREPAVLRGLRDRPDTGGAGRFRGGNGFVRAFRVGSGRAQICLCADRHETPPPGLFGGHPGAAARYVHDPGSHRERILPSKTPYIELEAGTLVHLQSAGGGGYGDPRERDPALVAEDLRNGYVTEAGAEAAYGFRANPERQPSTRAGRLADRPPAGEQAPVFSTNS